MLLIISFTANAQIEYSQPKGYSIYKDFDDKPFRLDKDFNGDGINDLAIVYTKNNSENENIVAVYFSTSSVKNNNYYYFPLSSNSYNLDFKNNVLSIGSCFGNGRFCKTLKFKFYSAIKNMRLIGYDEESFGNAVHEGAYLKSINLLTNTYEISGPKWKNKITKKTNFQILTLETLDEKDLEYLENVGNNYLVN